MDQYYLMVLMQQIIQFMKELENLTPLEIAQKILKATIS